MKSRTVMELRSRLIRAISKSCHPWQGHTPGWCRWGSSAPSSPSSSTILRTVPSPTWDRWETDPVHGGLAVFRYEVPRSASHHLVDFCCYRAPEDEASEDEAQELSFRDHPAYHGEVATS